MPLGLADGQRVVRREQVPGWRGCFWRVIPEGGLGVRRPIRRCFQDANDWEEVRKSRVFVVLWSLNRILTIAVYNSDNTTRYKTSQQAV
jgi:hypothetical protein